MNIRKDIITNKIFLSVLFLGLIIIFGVSTVSAANEIYVNTTGNDSGSGTAENPYLTIQKGVESVDPNGFIHIANGEYIGLKNTNITIDKNMTLIGQSQTGTLINGENSNWIFNILTGLNVTLSNLTIANGYSDTNGGAIQNHCELNGNNFGFNACFLTMNNCTLTGNTAFGDGGAISNLCTINITDVNVDDFDACVLNMNHCIFTGNIANGNGGAISNNCTLNVTGANADSIDFAACVLNVNDCKFTGNSADGDGGSISNYAIINISGFNSESLDFAACVLNVNRGTFTTNNAGVDGGIISNNCTINVNGVNADSIDFAACVLNVNDCNITSNTASGDGGAISHHGKVNVDGANIMSITACVMNVNRSNLTYNHAVGDGGAIWTNSSANLHFNRIVFNTAHQGNAIYAINPVDAADNWWGSNYNPKNNPNNFGGQVDLIDADPWLTLTITAFPTSIDFGGTSTITARVTINSDGVDTSSLGNIPDGTLITITTDLGNIGSKSVTVGSVAGAATVILKANDGWGIAHLYAILDNYITPRPATVVIAAPTTGKIVGMLETGVPLTGIILSILLILVGFITTKKNQ